MKPSLFLYHFLMAKKKGPHNKDVPSKTFIHKEPCLSCGKKLIRVSSSDRYLSTKIDRIRAFVEVYECKNKKCALFAKKIRPTELTNQVFPGLSYGIDLVSEMGIMRFSEKKTIPEIHETLLRRYPHIEITERHTDNVIQKFMMVIEAAGEHPVITRKRLLKKNKDLKGIVISIDGIQPEQGNEILYIIREYLTGEILFAKFLEFSDRESMKKEVFEKLKLLSEKIDLPILGFIVDKQKVFTQVIEELFPGTPIQHCQSHFLKDLRKPMREKDSEMARNVKKNFAGSEKSNERLKKKKTKRKKKF